MRKAGKFGTRLVSLLVALTVLFTTGCAGQKAGQDASGGERSEADGGDAQQTDSDHTAMGRYVEKAVDLSEISDKIGVEIGKVHSLNRLADGSLVILDEKLGQLISPDNGETWEAAAIPGVPDLSAFVTDNYIFDMKAAPDGTIALLSTPNLEEDGDFAGFRPELRLCSPDGAVRNIDVSVPEEEVYVNEIWFSETGELFALTLREGIYQADMENGVLSKYLTVENGADLLQFQGNYLMMLNYQSGILLYDRQKEEYVEDSVLSEFMRDNYQNDAYYTADTYSVYFFPGEKDVVYVAGEKGLYRHCLGGSAMEQVIDGNLSTFGNPSLHSMTGMLSLGNQEFMTLFGGSRLVRYSYDADVPTVPENMLTVYSLTEEDAIRQAISVYQTQNPDVYVRYEIGMDEKESAVRDDAVKKLNTEIMAGKGPDVLVMDGLPIDSYVEKGMLLDLSSYMQGMTGEKTLLPNVVESFTKDGKVYMLPVTIKVPFLCGKTALDGIGDMASLADAAERIRTENPGKSIIGLFSEEAALEWFLPMFAPAFRDKTGGMDRKALSDYLTQVKRLYGVSREGISEFMQKMYEYRAGLYADGRGMVFNRTIYDSEYGIGETVFMAGILDSVYSYRNGISLKRIAGLEDTEFAVLAGKDGRVFAPSVLTGINAASSHMEQAQDFFTVLMSRDVQELLYNGFAVNQSALQYQLGPDWDGMTAAPGEVCGSIGSSWEDGTYFSMEIYMPTEAETQELYDSLCAVDTPYLAEPVLEKAVIEKGAAFIRGALSLEEAVNEIEKSVSIYLSE